MNDYWVDFWNQCAANSRFKDEQSRVLRIRNQQPVDLATWALTLSEVERLVNPQKHHSVLDLACGNGLFARFFSERCKHVTAVDVVVELVNDLNAYRLSNVVGIAKDVRDLDFEDASFDIIHMYAAIQYLKPNETVRLFKKVRRWLKPSGCFFVADIPDQDKLWTYFNTLERCANYFQALAENKEIIGTWYQKEFLQKLCKFVGFRKGETLAQHPNLIYADFRYDLIAHA